MPLVQHSPLPTYDRLIAEGRPILPEGRAIHQDIRELHIGFCNLMPDAALEATERQFFRLVGESNRVAQIYIHPFTLPIVQRTGAMRDHLARYYESVDKLQEDGLDALIITGANEETNPHVSDAAIWGPLRDLLEWAQGNVTSTICSCLASHAALTYRYDQPPGWRDDKRWGVFRHRVRERAHPLVRGMNTIFDVPHSRYSEITRAQFEKAGMRILVDSEQAGVHMATSPDGFRLICLQGHPEYDDFSLLKEYRREVQNYQEGRRPDYPPLPDGYFTDQAAALAVGYQDEVLSGRQHDAFPEDVITPLLENTWADSARSVMAAWIGLVYQITHVDRRKPFMEGIDPDQPLASI